MYICISIYPPVCKHLHILRGLQIIDIFNIFINIHSLDTEHQVFCVSTKPLCGYSVAKHEYTLQYDTNKRMSVWSSIHLQGSRLLISSLLEDMFNGSASLNKIDKPLVVNRFFEHYNVRNNIANIMTKLQRFTTEMIF